MGQKVGLISSGPTASGGEEDMLLPEVPQIARGCGLRRAGDRHVLRSAHTTLETIRAFLQRK
jgi:hypothetical protein